MALLLPHFRIKTMGWSDLFCLLIGIGLGAIASRVLWFRSQTRETSAKSSEKGGISVSQAFEELQFCREQLQQTQLAYQMASEMSKFKGGFLARVSHELRSPLNGAIGMNQIILNDLCDSPEEERECVAKAHESALKLMKFIDEMVLVSKTEHGTDQMEIQPLDLTQMLQDIHRLTRQQAANRNLRLEILPPPNEIYVLADHRRLRQVLLNLVDSAIAQMSEGTIRLLTQPAPEPEFIQIILEDQRPASAWSDPIDLLTRPDNPTLPFTGKSSLGLSLLADKTLLELMNGQLDILAVPTATHDPEKPESGISRIQCTIPLVIPDLD